jgi:hypothetical protein
MTLPRALLLPSVLALLAACQGDSKSLDASSYDTSCQQDSDCTPVYFGPEPCVCEPLNGAINKSDDARYLADLAADAQGATCAPISCPAVTPVTAVCSKGTCAVIVGDGGI